MMDSLLSIRSCISLVELVPCLIGTCMISVFDFCCCCPGMHEDVKAEEVAFDEGNTVLRCLVDFEYDSFVVTLYGI